MLRLEKKKENDVINNYPRCENDLSYLESCENYSLYCADEIFRGTNRHFASRQKLNTMHSQYRACLSDAKEEYYEIMKEAVRDLEQGTPKEFRKLSSSSFVYDNIPRADTVDTSCKCHRNKLSAVARSKSHDGSAMAGAALGERNESSSKETDTYLIYLNDLSGLKVHNSYKFLLDVFSRRILLRSAELHDFVTYVETMLFVDPT